MRSYVRGVLVLAFVASSISAAYSGEPVSDATVAVLVEPGMVVYDGTPALAPKSIPSLLTAQGLRAKALTVDEILEPGVLTPEAYPVLVVPYGNAFPLPAFDVLRAYHAAGGCMVLNGIPFCHPCEKAEGKWKDLGGRSYFSHKTRGIGSGGHTDNVEGVFRIFHHGFAANILDLPNTIRLAEGPQRRQCLDAGSLGRGDEVIPIITLVPADGGEQLPVAAVIRHKCTPFPGAVDVWIGQAARDVSAEDAFLAKQLFVRGAAYCLREKGLLKQTAWDGLVARLDALNAPEPLPEDLIPLAAKRPWGDTYVPKSVAPARQLQLVNAQGLAPEARVALSCLQGLTSRERPRIWLNMSERDPQWLEWHKEKKHIDGYIDRTAEWAKLFEQYREEYKGAIVADAALYRGNLLAVNVAACEDLILTTPELAEQLNIPVRIDLRGRFDTYAEGMQWVWDTYKEQLSRHLCDFIHPDRLANGAFAYDVQWRGVMFWISGPVDSVLPGVDLLAETRVMATILSEMAPNTAVLGFPYAGTGIGPGEPRGVHFASRYAKTLVCTDSLANACVMSGVRIEQFTQPRPAKMTVEKDKIYIALDVSDGDNQNTWMAFFRPFFDSEHMGQFPIAFGMGPPIIDLMPGVAQYYFEHAPATTEFMADVSGIGYIHPEVYGEAYANPDAIYAGFLDWTAAYLAKLDMRTLRTVGGRDEAVQRYLDALPGIDSLFADMGRYSGREGIENLTYTLNDKLVFRAVTSWRYGKPGFPREIREQVGDARPAFVNGFVHCWTYDSMDAIKEHIVDKAEDDWVFVTPSQLADLYTQARARGWVK